MTAIETRAAELISDPADLRPETKWRETKWSAVTEEGLANHERQPRLCVAALLPFEDRVPDWEGFLRCIGWMRDAASRFGVEIVFVLNADTGYIFQLDESLYAEVLQRFRAAFPQQRFIAGVTARGRAGEPEFRAERYRPLLDLAQAHENNEVMLMTSPALAALDPERRRDAYFAIGEYVERPALVHALDPAFVPWATTFEPWLLAQLAAHPKFVGGKVSTLSEPHFLYWAALARDLRSDFIPHSGDDYGLATAIRLGLPLLVGAGATAAPLLCAALRMWRSAEGPFDARVYKLLEAIQSFEDVVFRLDDRGSAAAYKHSTAHALHLLGLLASAETHPDCPDRRRADEPERMREAMERPLRIAAELGIHEFQLPNGPPTTR